MAHRPEEPRPLDPRELLDLGLWLRAVMVALILIFFVAGFIFGWGLGYQR